MNLLLNPSQSHVYLLKLKRVSYYICCNCHLDEKDKTNYYDADSLSNEQLEQLKESTEKRIAQAIDDLNAEKLLILDQIEHLENGLALSTWAPKPDVEMVPTKAIAGRASAQASIYANMSFSELEMKKSELRRQIEAIQRDCGRKLPKGPEPPRNKVHWDYLIEEMAWMSNDFKLERRWKIVLARKLARAVMHYHATKEVWRHF